MVLNNFTIAIEQERTHGAIKSETELRERVNRLKDELESERKKLFDITYIRSKTRADMTHQYKQKQESLMSKITNLESNLNEKDNAIDGLNKRIEQMTENNRIDLAAKDNEIQELKKKINDMSTEFSNMLKVNFCNSRKLWTRWSSVSIWLSGTRKTTRRFSER